MSLCLWLPLIKNTDNLGLCNTTITNNGATINTQGKIGSCYSFDGTSNYINITNFNMGGLADFSITCWVKPTSNFNFLFLVRRDSTHEVRISGDGFMFRDTQNSSQRIVQFGNDVVAGEWVHIACVYHRGEVWLYQNGLLSTHSNAYYHSDGEIRSNSDEIRIGRQQSSSGNSYFDGCIQDFRIYDNVLNPREIREISKALIINFSLTGPGGENMMINTANPDVSVAANYPRLVGQTYTNTMNSGSVKTVASHGIRVTNTVANRIYVRFGGAGANGSMNGLVAGETYTFSFDATWKLMGGDVPGTSNIYFRAYIYDDRTTTGTFANHENYTIGVIDVDNRGKPMSGRCEFTFTIPTNVTMVYFDVKANSSNDTYYGANDYIELRNIKFEKGTKATPWTPAPSEDAYSAMGYDEAVEYDVSGYCNNGVKVGNLKCYVDSPRYNSCLEFGSNIYVRTYQAFYDMLKYTQTDEMTVSIWAKMDVWAKQTNNSMMVSCQQAGGFALYISGATGAFIFQVGTGTSSNAYKNASSAEVMLVDDISDGWHLFTGTYDGLNVKLYIDGELIATTNAFTTVHPVFYYKSVTNLFIGGEAKASYTATDNKYYFDGYLSDFRLYHTALTDDEVMELYHTPITLSSTATLLTQGEFEEV